MSGVGVGWAATKFCEGADSEWEEKKKEYAEIKGDEEPIKQWWETLDLYAVYYLWFTVTAM